MVVSLLPILAPLGSLLLGLGIGWTIGKRQNTQELARYREGITDASKKGFYWVRHQLPKNPEK